MEPELQPHQVLMVRRPIFNQQLKIVAYELLYQAEESDDQVQFLTDKAISQVLTDIYTNLTQDGVLQRVPLFIPLSGELLIKGDIPDLPRDTTVLEIPADIRVCYNLIVSLRRLTEQGYRLALNGFALQPQLIPLLKLVRIVKVDTTALPLPKLTKLAGILARSSATPMAQNIADHQMLQRCIQLKFKLFQGPFISYPVVVKGKKLSPGHVALMQLIQELQDPDITAKEIENLIILDPVLTYKILRVINSAIYRLDNKIESLGHAIVLLGHDQIRRWATLIALSGQEDKPEELLRSMLFRGRMSELMGYNQPTVNPKSCFMVGMLSQMDALLDMEIETLMAQIPLDDEIKAAIINHEGPMGEILQQIVSYEQGDWKNLASAGRSKAYLETAYRHSLTWSEQALLSLRSINN